MKDIAREAGVAQGLLHYYFSTRERLMEELVGRLLDQHLARFRADIAGASTETRRDTGLGVLRRKVLGDKRAWRLLFEALAGASRERYEHALAKRFGERRALLAQVIGGPAAAPRAMLIDALMLGLAAERLAGASESEVDAALGAFTELAK